MQVRMWDTAGYLMGYASQYGFGTGLIAQGRLMLNSGYKAICEQYTTYNWKEDKNTTFF